MTTTPNDDTLDAGRRMMTATENDVADKVTANANAATLAAIADAAERARQSPGT